MNNGKLVASRPPIECETDTRGAIKIGLLKRNDCADLIVNEMIDLY